MMLGELASQWILISVGALWLITGIKINRVRIHFLRKCPDEAKQYVTPLGIGGPQNATFLLRKDVSALLRQHADLWKSRQQALALTVASVLWPIICIVIFVTAVAFE